MTQPLSALEAELTDLATPGLSTLTRNQAHAARALADECGWCGLADCPERGEHERLDAGAETTWWRRWVS